MNSVRECSGEGTCAAARLHEAGATCHACGGCAFDHETWSPDQAFCMDCGADYVAPEHAVDAMLAIPAVHEVASGERALERERCAHVVDLLAASVANGDEASVPAPSCPLVARWLTEAARRIRSGS